MNYKIAVGTNMSVGTLETLDDCSDFRQYLKPIRIDGSNISYYYQEPFFNCQIASIASFDNLLQYNDKKNYPITLHKVWSLCIGKRMLMVDIKYNMEILENLFTKGEIVFKQLYTSTNGSNMTMYLLNMEKFCSRMNKLEEEEKRKSVETVKEAVIY